MTEKEHRPSFRSSGGRVCTEAGHNTFQDVNPGMHLSAGSAPDVSTSSTVPAVTVQVECIHSRTPPPVFTAAHHHQYSQPHTTTSIHSRTPPPAFTAAHHHQPSQPHTTTSRMKAVQVLHLCLPLHHLRAAEMTASFSTGLREHVE